MHIKEEIARGKGQLPGAGEKHRCLCWSVSMAEVPLKLLMTSLLEVIV